MRLPIQGIVERFAEKSGMSFAVVTPDGARTRGGPDEPKFTVVFRTEAALLSVFLRGHMGLMESYFDQEVDVEGDFAEIFLTAMSVRFDRNYKVLTDVENSLLRVLAQNPGHLLDL